MAKQVVDDSLEMAEAPDTSSGSDDSLEMAEAPVSNAMPVQQMPSQDNGLNFFQRLPGSFAGGVAKGINDMKIFPHELAQALANPNNDKVFHHALLSQALANKVPQFGGDPNYDGLKSFGIDNPDLLDKILYGAGEFAVPTAASKLGLPIKLAENAGVLSKIAKDGLQGLFPGAATNPQDPATGAVEGAALNSGAGALFHAIGSGLTKASGPALDALASFAQKVNAGGLLDKVGGRLRTISDNIRQNAFDQAKTNYEENLVNPEQQAWNKVNSTVNSPVGNLKVNRQPFDDYAKGEYKKLADKSAGRPATAIVTKPAMDMLQNTFGQAKPAEDVVSPLLDASGNKIVTKTNPATFNTRLDTVKDLIGVQHNINDYYSRFVNPEGSIPFSTIKQLHNNYVDYAGNELDRLQLPQLKSDWQDANLATQRRIQTGETLPDGSSSTFIKRYRQFKDANFNPDVKNPQNIPVGDFTKDYPIIPQDVAKTNANLRAATDLLGDQTMAKHMMLNDYLESSYVGDKIDPIKHANLVNDMHPDIQNTFLSPEALNDVKAINNLKSKFSKGLSDQEVQDYLTKKIGQTTGVIGGPLTQSQWYRRLLMNQNTSLLQKLKNAGNQKITDDQYKDFLLRHLAGNENLSRAYNYSPTKTQFALGSQLLTGNNNSGDQ